MSRSKDPPPRIVVDVHERASGIADLLAGLGAEVEEAALPAGDYAVSGDTLVERKRVLDLHGAVTKGRLWPQLAKLSGAVPFPYLFVEGTDLDRGPLAPNAIRGVCLAVLDLGIALVQTDHQRDTALWLHRLAVRCQRTAEVPERPAFAQRPKPAADAAAAAALAAVPGVSAATAAALLARFGSVAGVIAAGRDEWLTVAGVGPERADALERVLVGARPPAP